MSNDQQQPRDSNGANGTTRTSVGDQRLTAILATAEAMFFEKGYRGVSIRDLAAAVGIQMSSLYYYFPSKDEILYRIIKRHLEAILETAQSAIAEVGESASSADKLRSLIRRSIIFLIDDRMASRISSTQGRELLRDQRRELNGLLKSYENTYLDVIREGIKAGEFIETDVHLAGYIIFGAQVRLSEWFDPNGRLSPDEIAETYSYLLTRALLTDAALLNR